MPIVARCLLILCLATTAAGAATPQDPVVEHDASLAFVAGHPALVGTSFGLTAVDGVALLLGPAEQAVVADGLRTIGYACPGEAAPVDGARATFRFQAGKHYELVCHAGSQATIREIDDC